MVSVFNFFYATVSCCVHQNIKKKVGFVTAALFSHVPPENHLNL